MEEGHLPTGASHETLPEREGKQKEREILREDGTKVRERVEINKGGIPVTTELVVITRDGKEHDLLEHTGHNIAVISAEEAQTAIHQASKADPHSETPLSKHAIQIEMTQEYGQFCVIPVSEEGEKPVQYRLLYPDLSQPGNVLGFLHEIGHTRKHAQPEFEEREQLLKNKVTAVVEPPLRGAISAKQSPTLPKAPTKEGEVAIPIQHLYAQNLISRDTAERYLDYGYNELTLPEDLAKEVQHHFADEERSAWAFALDTLRKLRQEEVDLEPSFGNFDELREEIYGTLRTYEAASPFEEELFTKNREKGFGKFARIQAMLRYPYHAGGLNLPDETYQRMGRKWFGQLKQQAIQKFGGKTTEGQA